MEPGLYVVGTPIGNLADITLRALEVLAGVDVIMAEDTRHSRKLLSRHDIHTPLVSCHRFSEASRVGQVLGRIRAGEAVALVTDSGMPGVSDPGARIVAACREAGLPATVVPGPSALTAALSLCGFFAAEVHFAGFLPAKSGPRRRRLASLLACGGLLALFESPYRLSKLLDDLAALAPERRLWLGRELTKQYEETAVGTAAELAARFAGRTVKGELTMVVDEAPKGRRSGVIDTIVRG